MATHLQLNAPQLDFDGKMMWETVNFVQLTQLNAAVSALYGL